MNIEEFVEKYVREAMQVNEEVILTIRAKQEALENHDFDEAYRLAGIIKLMAERAEELDGRMQRQLGFESPYEEEE